MVWYIWQGKVCTFSTFRIVVKKPKKNLVRDYGILSRFTNVRAKEILAVAIGIQIENCSYHSFFRGN